MEWRPVGDAVYNVEKDDHANGMQFQYVAECLIGMEKLKETLLKNKVVFLYFVQISLSITYVKVVALICSYLCIDAFSQCGV